MVIPRAFSSGALSILSKSTLAEPNTSEQTRVRAAVRVVLPWSTWPIVPTLTCGLLRSNFSLAILTVSQRRIEQVSPPLKQRQILTYLPLLNGAHERTRTADLTLTKGVLYQLSYMSETWCENNNAGAGSGNRTRIISLEG